MCPNNASAPVVRFGVFEVDLRTGELRKSGVRIRLQERPFQILVMFLQRPGEVINREELRKKLWAEETFVGFDHSLNAAVQRLRESLGDSAENPRFIETLPRRGYRFLAPVDGTGSASVETSSLSTDQEAGLSSPVKPLSEARGFIRSSGLEASAIRTVTIVRFGVFQVDLRSGELYKAGLKVKVQQQPLQVLTLLLERPNDVVTREELRAKLWPTDTFVDFEHSLNTAVGKLRDALGDGAENPIFIETIPRKGYRFIAPLEVPASAGLGGLPTAARIPPPEAPPVATPGVATGNGKRTKVLALGIVIVIGLVGTLGWKIVHDRRVVPGSAPQIRSLAVLPLENLSGDPNQEYFADGMTEELTTDLGKISALRVISRTSAMQYKGTKKSLPDIARELNVDAVVEGTVARSGSHLRITANLLQTFPEKHLWAES